MANLNLAIIVRAVDRVTGPLKRIQQQTDKINEANRRAGLLARRAALFSTGRAGMEQLPQSS